MQKSNKIYDTVIIGSGPAGLTAAIYNLRADVKTIVVGGKQPGGQLTITTLVENFPGFERGIGGPKLMMDMMNQVKNLGGEILNKEVIRIEKGTVKNRSVQNFEVSLGDGIKLKSKSIIIATGARAKWLGVPGEKEFLGRGVSGCATCDGMFFRDKQVVVVGGGDVACTEAVFLAKFASKVYLIHRRDELRASVAQQKKVFDNPKIEIWWNTELKKVLGGEKVEKIKIKNNKTNEEKIEKMDGVFIAIGHEPATGFVADLVDRKENGQVILQGGNKYHTMTSCEGIFACGDCVDGRYRQAVIAAGMGAMAGLDAEKWVEDH